MSSHFPHISFPDNKAIRMQRTGTTELKACALKQRADKVRLEKCYSRGRRGLGATNQLEMGFGRNQFWFTLKNRIHVSIHKLQNNFTKVFFFWFSEQSILHR